MGDLQNPMVLAGPVDAFAQPAESADLLAECRAAVGEARYVLAEMDATEWWLPLSVAQVVAGDLDAEGAVDVLVGDWELARGRLSMRAWQLLRELLRAQVAMRVAVARGLCGPQGAGR